MSDESKDEPTPMVRLDNEMPEASFTDKVRDEMATVSSHLKDIGEDLIQGSKSLSAKLAEKITDSMDGGKIESEIDGLQNMTVSQLRAECKRADLKVSGRKAELVDRLRAHRADDADLDLDFDPVDDSLRASIDDLLEEEPQEEEVAEEEEEEEGEEEEVVSTEDPFMVQAYETKQTWASRVSIAIFFRSILTVVLLSSAFMVSSLEDGFISKYLILSVENIFRAAGIDPSIFMIIFGSIFAIFGLLPSLILGFPFHAGSAIGTGYYEFISVLLVLAGTRTIWSKKWSLYLIWGACLSSIGLRLLIPGMVENASFHESWIVVFQIFCVLVMGAVLSSPFLIDMKRKQRWVDSRPIEFNFENPLEEMFATTEPAESSELVVQDWENFNSEFQIDLPKVFDMPTLNQAVTKPARPKRRGEFELYEWIFLLVASVLWPLTIAMTVLLGSGIETRYGSFSMESNYIMLIGIGLPTLLVSWMLFRFDREARGGKDYAAEKENYHLSMQRYQEAQQKYLEYVALQADLNKQALMDQSGTNETGVSSMS